MARLEIEDCDDILAPRDEAFMFKLLADPCSPDLLTQGSGNLSLHYFLKL